MDGGRGADVLVGGRGADVFRIGQPGALDQDEAGEIYVMTKQDGMIRTFAPTDGTSAAAAESGLDPLLAPADQAATG